MTPSRRHFVVALLVAGVIAGAVWLAGRRESPAPTTESSAPLPAATPPRPPIPRTRAEVPVPEEATPPAPLDKDAVIATLTGRVIDAPTGRPLAHARLQWGYTDPATPDLQHDLFGETDEDGALHFVYPRTGWWAPDRPDDVAELWVAADGYRMQKIRAPQSPVEIRLEPLPDRRPGDVRVRALRGDGTPWKGFVEVEARDDFGDGERLCGIADDDGRFTLLAVPCHLRRFRVDDRMPWTEADVAPGGAIDADLRGAPPGPYAETTREAAAAKLEAAAEEFETAKREGDAGRAAKCEATLTAVRDELDHRPSAQRPLVFENLPEDAASPLEIRVETHDLPIVWRLPIESRRIRLSTPRDVMHWWRVTARRPNGEAESRSVMILGEHDGVVAARSGPGAAAERSFPLAKDGSLVIDWEKLVPDAR